jgi:predicted dehydrogenase
MGSKIKFAVLGLGNIGKRHLETIRQHPSCQLVAVCDTVKPQNLNLDVPFYDKLDVMLSEVSECAVINICTPNGFHAAHANICIEAGKHVVIEKPMALYKSDAEKVIFNALKYNVKVFCVMQNRLTPVARYLKHLIETDQLGEIIELSIVLNWNRGPSYFNTDGHAHVWRGKKLLDGGPLFTQFSHFIDLIYWTVGDINVYSVQKKNLMHPFVPEIEDCGVVSFGFGTNGIGSLHYSINAPKGNIISQVTITGKQGAIRIEGQYLEEIKFLSTRDNFTLPNFESDLINGHYKVMDNVVHSILNQKAIETNALEGMKVVEIIEKIYNFGTGI